MWSEQFTDKNGNVKYRFYEKYKDPLTGKWKRTSVVMNKDTKPSQREAQRQLEKAISKKINEIKVQDISNYTFAEAFEDWQEYYLTHTDNKKSTIKTYLAKSRKLLKIFDGEILIVNLNLQSVQARFDKFSKEKLSNQYNRDILMLFKNMMKYVKTLGDIDISYLDEIKVGKKAKTMEEIQAKKNNYLELFEVKEITDEIRLLGNRKQSKDNKRYYNYIAYLVEFMVLNGMRVGEALAIKVENIDFENRKLTIDGTIVWISEIEGEYGIKDTTKNQSSNRIIALSKRSCGILKKLILENKKSAQWEPNYHDRGFVFTNHTGNPIYFGRINDVLKLACKNCGIKKKVTTHTLRHTHISLLNQQGIAIKAIMQRVGHTDHRTTLQIYSHVTEKMDKEIEEKIEKLNI